VKALIATGAAVSVLLTGCGAGSTPASSTQPTRSAATASAGSSPGAGGQAAQARFLQTCVNPDDQYLTMIRDFDRAATSFSAAGGSVAGRALAQLVADVDAYETDLAVLAPHANADQRAQIDRYDSVLNRLRTGAQEAAGSDDQATPRAWAGVGKRLANMAALVASICNV
jgi:hypothetical protein